MLTYLTELAAPLDALHSWGSTMVGTGITPEGIEQNPVIYDLMAGESPMSDFFLCLF